MNNTNYSEIINMPKTERGEITLANIIEAAGKCFGESGYHRTTIADIAKAAGVAPGTIYIYFPDKYSIYKYLLHEYSHVIRMHIAKSIKGCTDRKEVERRGLLSFLQLIKENRNMYNVIWESLHIDNLLFVEYYTSFAARYIVTITAGQKSGELLSCDPEVLSYVLMGIANFVGLRYVLFGENEDLEKVADEVICILEEGIFKKV